MKITGIGRITVAALVALLALAGCSTTAGVEVTGKAAWDEQGARTFEKNVVFNSAKVKWNLQIVNIDSVKVGEFMRVQATVRSKNGDTVPFQYRFEWYDAAGFEINSGSGSWKPLILYGSETKNIQDVAPDPKAREFKLKIREAD